MRASEMGFELFISEVERRPADWDQRDILIQEGTQTKARLRKRKHRRKNKSSNAAYPG